MGSIAFAGPPKGEVQAARKPAAVTLSFAKPANPKAWAQPAWYSSPKALELPAAPSRTLLKKDSIFKQDGNPVADQLSPAFKRQALTPNR